MILNSTGNGPDIVLLHGWGLGSAIWAPVVDALAQRCRVHLIDLPGYSGPVTRMDQQSTNMHRQNPHEQTILANACARTPFDAPSRASTDSVSTFVKTADALSNALPEDCILCGWSLGGMLALQVAMQAAIQTENQASLRAPQRIKGLILIAGTPSFTQRADWPHAQPSSLLDAFSEAVRNDAATTLQRFIALLNQGDLQARALSRQMTRLALASPLPDTDTLLTGLSWLRDVDLRAQLPSIKAPTLLIHGEHDPLMPLAAAQWLKDQLPNARLEVFPATAHTPFLADPERFARQASDFCHEITAR